MNGCMAGAVTCTLTPTVMWNHAFIHYSNVNIRETTLDALRSPLFMQYRQRHPFTAIRSGRVLCWTIPRAGVMVRRAALFRRSAATMNLWKFWRRNAGSGRELRPTADRLWKKQQADKVEQAV